MNALKQILSALNKLSLINKIVIGLVAGISLALLAPEMAKQLSLLGNIFIGALKAVAPILVFFLVMSSIANQSVGGETHMKPVIVLYVIGTLAAAFTAVAFSFMFPVTLTLAVDSTSLNPPGNIGEVLNTLLFKIVQNPVSALLEGNYVALVAWGAGLGLLLRSAAQTTVTGLTDISDAITGIVRFVIQLAPYGIFGLVAVTVAETGLESLLAYGKLIALLLSAMLFIALVVNPIIVYVITRQNPYPLVLKCISESGITAFFTRSSAANIPVNMRLCEELELDKDTYSISIPLGATINMAGAAITVTVMSLAAVHTLGIDVDLPTALLLSVVSAVAACGASGVPGGSLLLIPLACGLFGIGNDIAMQVVAAGLIISVVQDSAETALNSSTDVIFTAAACHTK